MSSEHDHHHRRHFVQSLVLGASAATLVVRPAAGDEKPGKEDGKPGSAEPKSKTEVDARMELVLARFGERLDDDARASIGAEVGAIVRRAGMLREFPLENGDGPFPVFTPYRGPLVP
jgi:hypothetical protein